MAGQNQIAIESLPQYSVIESCNGSGKWGKLTLSSIRQGQEIAKQFARDENASSWLSNPRWIGLEAQSVSDYDQTGIAQTPLTFLQNANAALPKRQTRLAQPHAAISGGYWDTPSVLANIPLAARTRKRAKLAPINIKIAFVLSGGVKSEAMAVQTARIARAIWDYTLAGGAVSLTVAHVGSYERRAENGTTGLAVEMRVNCSDQAALAQAISPVLGRACTFPLMSAASPVRHDAIMPPRTCPLPGFMYIGGVLGDALRAADSVIKQLAVAAA